MKIKINLISENYKVNSTAWGSHTKLPFGFNVCGCEWSSVFVGKCACDGLCVLVINEVIGK